ncbi:MAG: AgmX/PglI C-terminal domain-containing protein, partial [Myxococcota bacterium]
RIPGLADPHAELIVAGSRAQIRALRGDLQVDDRTVASATFEPGTHVWLGDIALSLAAAPPAPKRKRSFQDDDDDPTTVLRPSVGPDGRARFDTEPPAPPPTMPPPPAPPAAPAPRSSPPPPRSSPLPASSPGPVAVPRSGKHPDDEDYDDELDFVAPFDLEAMLRPIPAPRKAPRGPCAASILRFSAGRVRHLGVVPDGESRDLPRGLRCACEGELVKVTWPRGTSDLRGGQGTGEPGVVVLRKGESVSGTIGPDTWRITGVTPFPKPLIPNLPGLLGTAVLLGLSVFFSLFAHFVLGVSVESLAVLDDASIVEEIQEEQFAEVEMKLEEPPEVQQRRETLALQEKAPAVSKQEVTRASEMPRSENTSVSSLLNRLSASAASTEGLTDAISTIDAVASSSGTNTAFNLAGRLAAGDGVKVARSGTGAVTTAGQVGDDVGRLAAGTRKGVRGKVTKLSSRMKVKGTLDPSDVTRVVNAHMGAIQACYEREMLKTPGLAGRILFEWTVATTG